MKRTHRHHLAALALIAATGVASCKKDVPPSAPPPSGPPRPSSAPTPTVARPLTDTTIWAGPPPQEAKDPYFLFGLNPTVPKALALPAERGATPLPPEQQRAALTTLRKLVTSSGAHFARPNEKLSPPRTPPDLAQALLDKRARAVHSFEAAALLASGLKQAGAEVDMCEAESSSGAQAGGGDAVPAFAVVHIKTNDVLDPMGGKLGTCKAISDQTAVAYHLALGARALADAKASPADLDRARALIAAAAAMPASDGHPGFTALKALVLKALPRAPQGAAPTPTPPVTPTPPAPPQAAGAPAAPAPTGGAARP